MGKSVLHQQVQKQQDYNENYDQRQMITTQDYELVQHSVQNLNQKHIKSNKVYLTKNNNQSIKDYEEIDFGHKRKKKKQKKIINEEQINARDIIDIIVIILLVLILGISLFRVVLEVQVQYRQEQQKNKHSVTKNTKNQELSEYEKFNRKNNPNQNYYQQTNKQNKKHKIQGLYTPQNNTNIQQEETKFNVSTQCRTFIDNLLKEKGYLYDFKVTYEELRAKSKVSSFKQNMNTQLTKEQFADAVDMLGLIHQTSFQGQLKIQQNPCQKIENKKERLQKVLIKQTSQWNMNYNVNVYHYRQLRFCLVVNSYNNAKNGLIYRNIDSILQQNYTNYHIVYTDDHSNDQTGEKVKQYLKQKNVPQNLFHVIINQQQKGMMENIYNAIHQHCHNGQIAVMIDGDDSFIGINVLALLNSVYQKQKPALLWANFVTIFNNQQVNLGFSRDYPFKNKKQGSFRKVKVFLSSHLKTFFVDVFKKISLSDLQTNDRKFYRGASDTAMMMPMLQMANPRIKYLPQILYQYRYDTGQSGNVVNKIPQKEALKKIFSSTPYKRLTDFSFVEKAINESLDLSQKQIQQIQKIQNR